MNEVQCHEGCDEMENLNADPFRKLVPSRFDLLEKNEIKIALQTLKALDGLDLKRAISILECCKKSVSDKAIVKTDDL